MNNVHISGAGTFSGGIYDQVHVSGSAKWNGDIECKEFHVSGAVTGDGNIRAAEEIHVSGSMKTKGAIDCSGEVHISGSLVAQGNITGCRKLHVSGGIKVHGDIEAEEVKISGGGTIEGLLNAEQIEICAGNREGSVRIGGIGGSKVVVKKPEVFSLFGIALSMKPSYTQSVVTETIEADEIDLVCTRAAVVRGTNVRIGEGCVIDRVEYSGTIEHDPSAVIREIVRVA